MISGNNFAYKCYERSVTDASKFQTLVQIHVWICCKHLQVQSTSHVFLLWKVSLSKSFCSRDKHTYKCYERSVTDASKFQTLVQIHVWIHCKHPQVQSPSHVLLTSKMSCLPVIFLFTHWFQATKIIVNVMKDQSLMLQNFRHLYKFMYEYAVNTSRFNLHPMFFYHKKCHYPIINKMTGKYDIFAVNKTWDADWT